MNLNNINASGVYAITNLVNGKKYIGSTSVSFRRRWAEHKRLLNLGKHHARQLQNSWLKRGGNDFEFSVLCVCESVHVLEMEQYFIEFFNSANPNSGYNQAPVAGNQLGIKRRPETIAKMRIASAGRIQSDDEKARRAEKHRKIIRTKEWRDAISRGQIGKKKSDSAIANIRAGQGKRIASRAGYRHSPETIEKIRQSNIATKAKNKAVLQLN